MEAKIHILKKFKMQKLVWPGLVILLLLIPEMSHSHSGGTNGDGCHENHKSGEYHCHSKRKSDSYERQMKGYRQHKLNQAFTFLKALCFLLILVGGPWYLIYLSVRRNDIRREKLINSSNYRARNQNESMDELPLPAMSNKQVKSNSGFSLGNDLFCYACNGYHGLRSFNNCRYCKEPQCRDCGKCNEACREKQELEVKRIEKNKGSLKKAEEKASERKEYFKNNPSHCFCNGTKQLYNKRQEKNVPCIYCH